VGGRAIEIRVPSKAEDFKTQPRDLLGTARQAGKSS
jgi:hypothetical protein